MYAIDYIFFNLITCLLDSTLILFGETILWKRLGEKGKICISLLMPAKIAVLIYSSFTFLTEGAQHQFDHSSLLTSLGLLFYLALLAIFFSLPVL